MKNSLTTEKEKRGWITIYLIVAIVGRNSISLEKTIESLTINYEEKEIQRIWKKAKSFLTEDDIKWLLGSLKKIQKERNEQ